MTSIYLTDAARNRKLRDEAMAAARKAWGAKQREFLVFVARRHSALAVDYSVRAALYGARGTL